MSRFVVGVAGLLFAGILAAQTPTQEEMWSTIQQQQRLIEQLQAQLNEINQNTEEARDIAISTADAVESQMVASRVSGSGAWYQDMTIGGYGEHHLNLVDEGSDQVDAHRFVLFFGHNYSDSLRFFSELELEHSLAGEGKPGEVELEQAFVEWQYNDSHRLTAGLYLLPVGILNETHEPDTFYGVERNMVEAEVIPSTWWETGLMFSGEIAPGLSYDASIHSGLATNNFRIRSGRQKSAEAIADDPAYTARIRYTGIPGLELASTLQYQTDITQGMLGEEASATLVEAHAAYQGERFGLRALYAGWNIDNDAFETNGSDAPSGWYVEPSYRLTNKLGLFTRYSQVDPARGDQPTQKTEQLDIGFNYWLHPQVVVKADYMDSQKDGNDAFNLGIGWSY